MSLDTTPDKKIVKVSLTFLFIRGKITYKRKLFIFTKSSICLFVLWLKTLCDWTGQSLVMKAWASEGRACLPPMEVEFWHFPIKFLVKKGCFLTFENVIW